MLSFIQLPAEVRNNVYEYLFHGAVIEDYGLAPDPIHLKNYHLSITATCRQLREESLSVLRASTTYHFRIAQAGAPQVPPHVLTDIKTVRIPAYRLETLDTGYFKNLETLVLDVSLDPGLWKLFQAKRGAPGTDPKDVSDMIALSMTLGLFQHSWDVDRHWRDTNRKYRILCWLNARLKERVENESVLVDIDKGFVIEEQRGVMFQ